MSGGEPPSLDAWEVGAAWKVCLPFKGVSVESSTDSAAGCVLGPLFPFSS